MITAAANTEIGYKNVSKNAIENMHPLGELEIMEREWLLNILAKNNERDFLFRDSLLFEIRSFARFVGAVLPPFGVAMILRKIVRKNKKLNQILQFEELKQVRNNIEKGSFAYDTILFKQPAIRILKNKSHLANLVCLAILFGDEFIDGIAQVYGKDKIQQILCNGEINFSLQQRTESNRVELYYQFDIRNVLPDAVLKSINEKYGISYSEFYEHLLFLLSELNLHLNKLNKQTSALAANLICAVCNKCFDTYQMDIVCFSPAYSLQELMDYQKKKDDDIIQGLLTLRSVLLQKKTSFYQSKFASWSTMVRTMQVYDDMQDVATDANYQMNFLCYFAKNYFKSEWDWLQSNLQLINRLDPEVKHLAICVQMPASVMMCMQYAKSLALDHLNWEQKKITAYLWNKNWFAINNADLTSIGKNHSDIYGTSEPTVVCKLRFLQENVLTIKDPILDEQMIYAHIADIAFMDVQLRKSFFGSIGWKDAYFLQQSLFDFPVFKKASLVKRWMLEQIGSN